MEELVLTRDQSRMVDQIAIHDFGIPGVVLMENAGRNVAEILMQHAPTGRVTILCGKGNNGGDGFVIARHLDNHGYDVVIVLLHNPEELTGDAAINYQIIDKSGLACQRMNLPEDVLELESLLAQSEWVVDALLGTGVTGTAREPFLSAIKVAKSSDCKVLAVDVPSGLDSDSGPIAGATVVATITATFVAMKPGLVIPDAADFTGRVEVVDIGLPRGVLTKLLREGT